jgi:uncharacterized repeat protein (TIGR03803 family)
MKLRILRLCTLALISLFSLFTFPAAADAQDNISKPQEPEVSAAASASGFRVLYRFCHAQYCTDHDGFYPEAGLIQDAAGNLWGTTTQGGCQAVGGPCGGGTVFEVASTGKGGEVASYSPFCAECPGQGFYPVTALLQDAAGNLYGTTAYGGNLSFCGGCGTVFNLASFDITVYSFCSAANCTDGAYPSSALIEDAAGNLYGTTSGGGDYGGGTVFKLDSTGNETVLYSFCAAANCADGSGPNDVIQDATGNLYGTTFGGGTNGGGTAFKLDNTGKYTVLYSFCSAAKCTDGSGPNGVVQDAAGDLYGTTSGGGRHGGGTAFKLKTTGHERVLYNFCSVANCTDGGSPNAVIRDAAGNLYGTTFGGGANGVGTVFKVDSTGHETVFHSFCSALGCRDGSGPVGSLVQDSAGYLYGTTAYGGNFIQEYGGFGTVFKQATRFKAGGIALTSSVNPSFVDQRVILSAVVSGGGETPTGSVTFKEGRTVLGTVTLTDGQAGLTIAFKKSGTASIEADYSGDANYETGNSSPLKQVVSQYTTSMALISSLNPSTYGQAITLTAMVNSAGGPAPTGGVTFKNGSAVIRSAPLSGGVARIKTSTLPTGTSPITAIYEGDEANAKSTSPVLNQVVNEATTAAIVPSLNPPKWVTR